MKLPLIVLALALTATTATPSGASAASFDCAKARAPDEKAVCANLALNDKDVKLSVLYDINRHTLAMGGRGALEDAQRQWLRDRKTCGANRACLNRAYDKRLDDLDQSTQRIYRAGPF